MMRIVIFDLDGCISDDRYRRKFLPSLPEGEASDSAYYKYNSMMSNDAVCNGSVFETSCGDADLILVITARPERFRQSTAEWLDRKFGVFQDGFRPKVKLAMRPHGDLRRSPALKVDLLGRELRGLRANIKDVVCAYDDRQDVLDAYVKAGVEFVVRMTAESGIESGAAIPQTKKIPEKITAAEVLFGMAKTYKERNAVYGDNFRMVAKLVSVLFPNGVPSELVATDQWHLFELKLVKISRFAISNLTHQDSIHDDAVYSAMIESILLEKENNNGA